MRTHQTKRVYRVRCKSGVMGWRTRLRNIYAVTGVNAGFDEWLSYSAAYELSNRLGYKHARAAWNANPVIEGSVNPSDFRKVKS